MRTRTEVAARWSRAGKAARRCGATRAEAGPTIHVAEAEAGFVDGTNLEDGEGLVRAVKVFDDQRTLLVAAALVETAGSTERRRTRDIWLGDSIEPRVSANVQVRAARVALDTLVDEHLRTMPIASLRVHAPSGTASLQAALDRGYALPDPSFDPYGDDLVWTPACASVYRRVMRQCPSDGAVDWRESALARAVLARAVDADALVP